MSFPELPRLVQSLTAVWTLVVLLMFLYNLVRCLQLKRSPGLAALTGVLLAAAMYLYQALCYGLQISAWQVPLVPAWFGFLMARPALVFGLLAVLTSVAAVQQYRLGKWIRTHLSVMSVKEAFDRLPTGMSFSRENGRPLLVNTEMERICRELTGQPPRNPARFWRHLSKGDYPGTLRSGESPVLELKDGRVYNIQRSLIPFGGESVQELMAVDVTEPWQLTSQLEEKQDRAKLVNTRLKALLGTIEYVTMSRELLQIKTSLHNRIGETLLLTKRCMLQPGSVDRTELLSQWRQDLAQLSGGGAEPWQAPYYVINREAVLLGIELRVNGELPQEGPLMQLADLAIQTHMTNVLRHAGGSAAYVDSEHIDGFWRITLTNDGEAPHGPVRETGGLANLRKEAEAVGGTLTIESEPRFRMTMILPEKGGIYEL